MSISLEAEKTTANPKRQPTTAANAIGLEDAANARSWLESLSPEECAAALSFRDGPFLASFLDLAASSLSSSSSAFSLVDGLTHNHGESQSSIFVQRVLAVRAPSCAFSLEALDFCEKCP